MGTAHGASAQPLSAAEHDETVDVDDAARPLGMSRSWVYRHASRLRFTRRVGRRALGSPPAESAAIWRRVSLDLPISEMRRSRAMPRTRLGRPPAVSEARPLLGDARSRRVSARAGGFPRGADLRLEVGAAAASLRPPASEYEEDIMSNNHATIDEVTFRQSDETTHAGETGPLEMILRDEAQRDAELRSLEATAASTASRGHASGGRVPRESGGSPAVHAGAGRAARAASAPAPPASTSPRRLHPHEHKVTLDLPREK